MTTMRIDGRPGHVCWVLVDLSAPTAAMLRSVLAGFHADAAPAAKLSENRSAAGDRALIKVARATPETVMGHPASRRGAVLRIFTAADHHEAVALVSAEDWAPREQADVRGAAKKKRRAPKPKAVPR